MSDFVRKSDVLHLLYGIFDKYRMSTDKTNSIGNSFGNEVFEEIRNMPTAYSVDKVVEELGADSSVKLYGSGNSGNYLIPVNRAVEIARKGGTTND